MEANDLDLALRSLDGTLDAEDAARLERLLHASPEARAEMDHFRTLRDLVAEQGAGSFAPSFADRVMKQVAVQTRRPAPAPLGERWARRLQEALLLWRAVGWSLAVAVVLIGVALWPRPTVVRVPHGQTASLVLPDGSSVELGSGSTLRYGPFEQGESRAVELEGEAFFKVVREPRPFVVETFNARVVVQGTRFNVQAWAEDDDGGVPATTVTLTSGRVAVAPRTSEAPPVVLAPGQTSVVTGDTAAARPPVAAEVSRALAWRSGGLAFADQPLGSVAKALERRFDVEIRLASPELAALPLTYFNPHPVSAPSVLADICHVQGLRFRRTAGGFRISRW